MGSRSGLRSPVAGSIVVKMQRTLGLSTRNSKVPMRRRFQPSSANGSAPCTTRFGRNRSISIARPTRRLSSSSEPWPISNSGKPSGNAARSLFRP
ncbi:hypothetical protein D3C79_423240 [compost metagenome]